MKAVIFDVDDTLYDQMIPFEAAFEQVFKGKYDIPCHEFYEVSRKYGDIALKMQQRGEITMRQMHASRIVRSFESYGIKVPEEEALKFQEIYSKNQKQLKLSEQMMHILDYCACQPVITGVISNGQYGHQWEKIQTLGLTRWIPREHIFISEQIGVEKPDIRAFRYVEEKLGLNGKEVYFAGDSFMNDIEGAHHAGWKTIWMNRRKLKLPQGSIIPDMTVTDEAGLYHVIQEVCGQERNL